jgi:hypothetical protein
MDYMEVEQSLLGCILLRPAILKQIQAVEDDFQAPLHRKIFKTMWQMHEDGEELEYLAVAQRMPGENLLNFLTNLYEHIGTAASFAVYDKLIREESAKVKAELFGNHISKMARNGSPVQDILAKATELQRLMATKLGERKPISDQVREYIQSFPSDTISVTDSYKDLGLVTVSDKNTVRQSLKRLEEMGEITRLPGKRGIYRKVDKDVELINFIDANPHDIFPIRWPFNIQDYVKLLPKSVVILAGTWDAGKTAFLLNVVRMNMAQHRIRYMSSEMGAAELRLRLDLFVETAPEDWKFEAIERSSNWEDVILADSINIIDYLEIADNFYQVGEQIRKIFDRLRRGIAIIALQKVPGKDLARGGHFTAEKPRLYLALDQGEISIIKGKLWANPQINPRGMTFKFKLWQGHKFVQQGEGYKKIKEHP